MQRQADNLHHALAAETQRGKDPAPVYATLAIHVAAVVAELDPTVDARIAAGFILNAIAPPVLERMRNSLAVDTPELQATARALLRGFTSPEG